MKCSKLLILVCLLLTVLSTAKTAFSADPPAPTPVNETSAPTLSHELSQEKAPLFLGLGEQRDLRIAGLSRYSIGGKAIRVHRLGKQLLIKGVAPGLSDVWVWKSDGLTEHWTIHVQNMVGLGLKPALLHALGELQEVEVLISGAGVLLRGKIRTLSEAARIEALTEGFPADIRDETRISQPLLEESRIRLQNWIAATHNNSRIEVSESQGTLWVRGSIDDPKERAVIERQLRSVFPLVQTELESLPDNAPTVHFRVFLLELRKDHFHTLGLGWPASQPAAFHVTTSAVQDQVGLDLALNVLQGEGAVKVLSSPELVVRAPGKAELFSGGQIPIRADGKFYSNVAWKSFGLSLKLNVTSTTVRRVRLNISTEVSHLDPSLSQDPVPGIVSNSMSTQVDAEYGVPLFLSGLLQENMHKTAQGFPLLRSIPVLGALFGSEDYLKERSELVAILLPSSAPPPAMPERFADLEPKGLLPPPRDWVSPREEKRLKRSSNYPWNALK